MRPGSLQSEIAISHVDVASKPCGDHVLEVSQGIPTIFWAVCVHVPQVDFPVKA